MATVHDLRAQPAKSLYLLYQALSVVTVRLPWWVLISIPRSNRSRPSWTLRKAVYIKFVQHMYEVTIR